MSAHDLPISTYENAIPVANSSVLIDNSPLDVSSPPPALPRRRNGKPQSCEPCRKAKVSCDHALPKCGRCLKKGLEALCDYHPAPMTRQDGVAPAGVVKHRKPPSKTSVGSADSDASKLLLLLSRQRAGAVEGTDAGPSHDYLGPTSFTAIFRENQTSIGIELWNSSEGDGVPQESTGRDHFAAQNLSERVERALEPLWAFPSEDLCERLLGRYFTCSDAVMHEPSIRFCLRAFWATWGETLRSRDPGKMREMAKKIVGTPRTPMRAFRTSADWLQSFSGDNLGLEMIGTFLAIFCLGNITIPEWDPFFENSDKQQYSRKLGEAAEACLDLCSDKPTANEPLVWLTLNLQICQSQYRGDDDGYLWRKAGYVATAITSLGLHRAGKTDSAPFMVAELRRRIFAAAYIYDKQLATFTGRPPRLSWRYSHCQLPLDLSEDQLMAEGEELQRHMSSLDAAGWSRTGKCHHVTIIRAWMIAMLLRDEILEMCLGSSAGMSLERRDELKRRSKEAYNNLPAHLQVNAKDPGGGLSEVMLCVTVQIRLEFLLNCFLLERIPGDESNENKQNLIDTAVRILNNIVLLQRNRDRLTDFVGGLTWGLVYCGIPAAGVLMIELLKQHRSPKRYRLCLSLTRSEIVQHLSVFVFCLSVVRPTEGNYKICVHMQKVVQKILEKVLEPPEDDDAAAVVETPTSSCKNQTLPDVDIPAAMGSVDDPEFMDWLNSVDWAKGPWMDTFG